MTEFIVDSTNPSMVDNVLVHVHPVVGSQYTNGPNFYYSAFLMSDTFIPSHFFLMMLTIIHFQISNFRSFDRILSFIKCEKLNGNCFAIYCRCVQRLVARLSSAFEACRVHKNFVAKTEKIIIKINENKFSDLISCLCGFLTSL